MSVAIIIPTLNPSERLGAFVRDLKTEGFENILVVDDGSEPDGRRLVEGLRNYGVRVLRHDRNLGKGQAIKTALSHAREFFPHITHVVTADDNGQHLASDVAKVARAAAANPEAVVLGTRDFTAPNVPAWSRLGNTVSATCFYLVTGTTCPDTQTGLRAIPVALAGIALSVAGERYDYEMNFLVTVACGGMELVSVPITTVYLDQNRESHFRPVRDSLLVLAQPMRRAARSLACAATDLALFDVLVEAGTPELARTCFMATIAARLASGTLYQALRPHDGLDLPGENGWAQVGRAIPFCAAMLASAALVTCCSKAGMNPLAAKVLADGALFALSWLVHGTSPNLQARIPPQATHAMRR